LAPPRDRFTRPPGLPDIEVMMRDPAVKIALALCIVLTGVLAAALLRQPSAPAAQQTAASAQQLSIPCAGPKGTATNPRHVEGRKSPDHERRQEPAIPALPATVLKQQSPPPLKEDSSQPIRSADARQGSTIDTMLPVPSPEAAGTRTHRIVDGDTLPALAQRFLGDAGRAQEIFECNRGVLTDPKLLPIGAELKIPSR
jgi:nucleoid-associated protein YgaU